MNSISTRVRAIGTAGALALALATGLTACSQSAETVSAELHASVVQVAERAAAGDYVGAIAELALLEQDVSDAVDDGTIGPDQEREIREALTLVQADLEAAEVASTPAPAPAPVDGGGDDGGPGNDDKGEGNDDKGKDKGKGKGDD